MIEVSLSDKQLKWCRDHAQKIVDYYGGNNTLGSGSYNHNKISSNLVGVKSEVATTVWLKRHIDNRGIAPNFVDFKKHGKSENMPKYVTIVRHPIDRVRQFKSSL